MKTCGDCGVEKPLDDFHKSRSGKHGRSSACKPCRYVRMTAAGICACAPEGE